MFQQMVLEWLTSERLNDIPVVSRMFDN